MRQVYPWWAAKNPLSERPKVKMSSNDVTVVGAGVVGAAVAYYLSEAGLSVTVLDDRPIGTACTLHGSGQVWKMIWNDGELYRFAMEARGVLFELVPTLWESTGIDPQLHRYDTVMPIFDDEDRVRIERDQTTSGGDLEVRWLDRAEVLSLEPRINPEVVSGAFLAGSAQIDGYALTLALAEAARRRGARFLSLRATGIERQGGRVRALLHTGGRIPCSEVVICMGAWSNQAAEWLGFPVPIKPLKGETVRVRPAEPFPVQVFRPSGGGANPRKDGLVSLGATGTNRFNDLSGDKARIDEDPLPTRAAALHMLESSQFVVPSLSQAEVVYHLAGPRPLSADGMPIIGPVPGLAGAYLATGHRNKGIHLAPLTGRIIRDHILHGTAESRSRLERFLPDRFADKESTTFNVAGVTTSA